ncbi:MAG: response regulator [Candidatus Firestonebacteria bacterium]|nr:response regulator [Candidatus Firestonebacteria bacterium]
MLPKSRQVYIVDDDGGVGRALMMLLTTCGYKATAFSSTKAFFAAVPFSVPGCLILDVHMPGADAWKTLELSAQAGHRRPVILISGDLNDRIRERTLKAGVVGFLQKPFSDTALIALLQRVFEQAELKPAPSK